jgi:hypothetical protein
MHSSSGSEKVWWLDAPSSCFRNIGDLISSNLLESFDSRLLPRDDPAGEGGFFVRALGRAGEGRFFVILVTDERKK